MEADPNRTASLPQGDGPPRPTPGDAGPDLRGTTVAGRYKILTLIGEGGFGLVYEAEQQAPMRRRVALKVLKPGMDSRAVLARFDAERQALAVMDHPNIARVLDGGATEQGLPYFVMELVRGDPITDFCDKHRLTVRQRIELFTSVCHAVQHAHMKGVIHRDLKPSNILVEYEGGRPTPKVIDFGVAKAVDQRLSEHTIFTERGQMIGTPEYMSPEQAEMSGLDIDTRADVYSLGAVLYELLTGLTPFDSASLRRAAFAEIQRIIREVEPPKPSTRISGLLAAPEGPEKASKIAGARRLRESELAPSLRHDLDWIVVRCLEKDRDRRYATPLALAEDLVRHLSNQPVEAGPPSAAYRFAKFIRRNRAAAAATAVIAATLALGVTGTAIGLVRATAHAHRADTEAEAARAAEVKQRRLADEARRERDAAERARRTIEYNAYVANVQMAGAALEMQQFAPARERLDACPERLRGWEWHWLNARSDQSLVVLTEHKGDVLSASFSPDGTRIVTASADETARIWDAATGESLAVLAGHRSWVNSAAFSPDGTRIVTASNDGTARVCDAATGESLAVLTGHMQLVFSAAFSPDGTRIVTALRDGTARVWEAGTEESLAVLTGHTDEVVSAVFSPEGTRIVTASADHTARIWDAATGESLAVLTGHRSWVHSAAFSPDGTRIVTASADHTARIWNAATGESLAVLTGHRNSVLSASFSPDGTRIVTASLDHAARIWDAATGESLAVLTGHTKRVFWAAFSPDGTRIATASYDLTAHVLDAVPYRIRYAERQANARGEDGGEIVRQWMRSVGFPGAHAD